MIFTSPSEIFGARCRYLLGLVSATSKSGLIVQAATAAMTDLNSVITLLSMVPTPVIIALVIFVFLTLVILDVGAGDIPIFYPMLRPFMKQFKPTREYSRLKSKYMP